MSLEDASDGSCEGAKGDFARTAEDLVRIPAETVSFTEDSFDLAGCFTFIAWDVDAPVFKSRNLQA